MRRAPEPLYRGDLARIHHEGFGSFSRRAAAGILRWLRDGGIRSGKVVDLGCGSGILLAALRRAGHRPVGVDPSRAFIRMAREAAPGAELHVATASTFDFPPCDAVTAVGEVLGYRESGGRAKARFRKATRRIAGALRPGGLLVFDLVMAGGASPMVYELSRRGEGWEIHLKVREDRRRGLLVREIETRRMAGGRMRRSRERHALDLLRRDQVEGVLRSAGFAVRAFRSYGSFPLPPRRLAFRARKR